MSCFCPHKVLQRIFSRVGGQVQSSFRIIMSRVYFCWVWTCTKAGTSCVQSVDRGGSTSYLPFGAWQGSRHLPLASEKSPCARRDGAHTFLLRPANRPNYISGLSPSIFPLYILLSRGYLMLSLAHWAHSWEFGSHMFEYEGGKKYTGVCASSIRSDGNVIFGKLGE